MIKSIAGIGSRQTPADICKEMEVIGSWCRSEKVYVRSGHADGADYAFEKGAKDFCIAFVPWKAFNGHLPALGKIIVPVFTAELLATVDKFHPAPERLSPGVRNIMARNACQVLGQHLNDPSDVVVCWTKDARDEGGTAQAIRIARVNQILILNMAEQKFNTAAKVIEFLKYYN